MAPKLKTGVKQRIITEQALAMLAKHGLAAVNIAGLAQRVGLVPSGIYRHFKSKDEIVDAVLNLILERLTGFADEASEVSLDPFDQLRSLLQHHVAMLHNNPGIPSFVFAEAIFSTRSRRRAKVRRIVESYLGRVARIIERGQELGRIRSDVEPKAVAVMFLGLIQPLIILRQITDGTFDVERQMERSWPLFVEMVKK
jgi:AcrR family transcriptional regulator